jgi:hypothetical protein
VIQIQVRALVCYEDHQGYVADLGSEATFLH